MTLVTYPHRGSVKVPGPYYTFTYSNGIRATLCEYQGDMESLSAIGKKLSSESGREIRMQVHNGRKYRIAAIFNVKGGRD